MTFPSKSNRPKWSFETHFWAAVVIATIASACVLLISKKNIWVELEIIVGVLSLICFAYFLFLFYYSIRFEKKETYSIVWKPFRCDGSWFDTLGMVDNRRAIYRGWRRSRTIGLCGRLTSGLGRFDNSRYSYRVSLMVWHKYRYNRNRSASVTTLSSF
jgi:hypothetical protein